MTADNDPMQVGPPITWIDVARALSRLDPTSDSWLSKPKGLYRVHVDWAGANFGIDANPSTPEEVKTWLKDVVPGLLLSDHGNAFRLDGPEGLEKLPIEYEIGEGPLATVRVSLGAIDGDVAFGAPSRNAATAPRPVPVIACHSVKGGTGRTTSAIAIASIWQRRAGKPILVVDADIEAPGLSYLFAETRTEARVSFEDLITLAHASPDQDKTSIAKWVANRLQSQRLGQLVVLPLRRALDELASSTVRAEHLASPDNPYALADIIAITANAAGCAGAVVDLRAGLVPVSLQLMLDPDVPRVLCTSLSSQSINATGALFSFISRELRKLVVKQTPPLLIVNRIPTIFREYGTDDKILDPILRRIETSLIPDDGKETPANVPILNDEIALTPFIITKIGDIPDLHVPRSRWDDFAVQLETSGFVRQMQSAVDEWLDRALPASQAEADASTEAPRPLAIETPEQRRGMLNRFSNAMEFAESKNAISETPLVTGPLRAFGQEGQTPIVVSEGAKGTGKTLTARYFVGKGTWRKAMEQLVQAPTPFDAQLLPVVSSTVGGSDYLLEVDGRRRAASAALGLGEPQKSTDTKDEIASAVATSRTQPEWTKLWLDIIAWAAGFEVRQLGAGERFLSKLRETKTSVVAIVEGIEEIRATTADNSFVAMLGSLLVDLPARLRTEQGRPLGLIVFARRDTVEIGVPQNVGQFRQQYKDFALTWDEPDVLELAAWLATKSGALSIWDASFKSRSRVDQEQLLERLWGRKLGPDDRDGKRTQEAYTANWVLAVLSDLQGRLTARDLVRFVKEASSVPVTQQEETQYSGRLLSPSALRRAVGPTSDAKVSEIQEEVPELKTIFAKIRQHTNAVKAPISQENMQQMDISLDELMLLKTHGVILDESPPYEVPELFRIGLGLTHGGARRNVIGIMRRAKERTSLRNNL
ncbi:MULTISPECIES: KGGVGR-motif variant AAA ATPase [unclassified Mesorhizobium]|uniref:KGGVGR-motif variant AAA ATPase n=1 Tax=unclassified Mesorhizobium TaxID=325217 RepID=UPI0015E318AC|nr:MULTISPECIES: AAA family ATPase [unclassified Mesorhizobium]MBZ9958465.1 AAA family ATPase [Mesorhizobium sp. BR1-1-14]